LLVAGVGFEPTTFRL